MVTFLDPLYIHPKGDHDTSKVLLDTSIILEQDAVSLALEEIDFDAGAKAS